MTTKAMFPVHALLSVYTGRLAGDFGECHRLIEHLVGEPCWTHQLPTIMQTNVLQNELRRQLPALDSIATPTFDGMEQAELAGTLVLWNDTAVKALGAEEVAVEGGACGAMLYGVNRDKLLEGKEVIGIVVDGDKQ